MNSKKVPSPAEILKECERVSKDLKTKIRIRLDDREITTTKEDYIEAKTKQMVEFGYGSLTEDQVARQLDLLLAGKTTIAEGLTVIGMFMKQEVMK